MALRTLTLSTLSALLLCAGFRPAFAAEGVAAWVSALDGSESFAQAQISFSEGTSAETTVVIDSAQVHQSILGIGSSLEHATCYNLSQLDPAVRADAITKLVHPDKGIGMSLMRICIGTSDFVGEPWYSYDDMPEGETDPEMEHFSIEKDRAYVLPIIKAAHAENPDLLFFASPWSPPAWMKNRHNMCGGRLLPEYYDAFARYLIRFIETYEAEGVPIHAITMQNEPGVGVKTYPSCFWNGEMQRDFIKNNMGPALRESGLDTQLWCFDHNFNNTAFPRTVLEDPEAAQYVDGTAFHHYEGQVGAMGEFAAEFPKKPVYFTEGSVYGIGGACRIISFLVNGARSYNAWVTVIDDQAKPNNGPHNCSPTCIVMDHETRALEYRFDYYMYGHFAKFIQRGALRLTSTPGDRRFANIALKNPDGATVLIVANNEGEEKTFSVQTGAKAFKTTLPAKAVAAYRWTQ